MNAKTQMLLIGCIIMSVLFSGAALLTLLPVSGLGFFVTAEGWIRLGLLGGATAFIWMLFFQSRRESQASDQQKDKGASNARSDAAKE